MRLLNFKLSNYRQYANLDLRFSRETNLVVLVGKNGAGKTNLLNALTWCIYGEENKQKNVNSEHLGLANINALMSSQEVEVSAELTLEFDDGSTAYLKRTQVFKRTQNGVTSFSPSVLKLLTKKPGAGGFAEQDSELFLKQRMPKELETFFLFDGEKLDEYFRVSSNDSVKSAVLRIAKIDILQRMIKRLDGTRKGLLSQATDHGGHEIEETKNLLVTLEEKLRGQSEKMSEIQRAIDMSEAEYSDIEDLIRLHSSEQEKFSKLKALQQDLDSEEKAYESKLIDLCIEGAKIAPILLNLKTLQEFTSDVEARRSRRELPSVYSIETIDHVISEGTCICGRDVHENASALQHLKSLSSEHASISRIGQILMDAESSVIRSMSIERNFRESLPAALLGIGRIQEAIDRFANEKHDLELEIKNSPEGSTPEYLLQLRQVKELTEEQKNKRLLLQGEIDATSKEISKTEATLTSLVKRDSKNDLLTKQILLAGQCHDAAQSMFEECVSSTVASVNAKFSQVYEGLIWKEMSAQASIDESFKVSVVKEGIDHFGSLSVGENECLAFAFSIALGSVSNYELPMIVDTPLGKLSEVPQLHVCESFCAISKKSPESSGQQVILLVTDTEYNPAVAEKLSANSPQLLSIEFDHLSDISRVVERV